VNKNYIFEGDQEHDTENSDEQQRRDCFLKHGVLSSHSHYLFDLSLSLAKYTNLVGFALCTLEKINMGFSILGRM
jgi:hypothetical protein